MKQNIKKYPHLLNAPGIGHPPRNLKSPKTNVSRDISNTLSNGIPKKKSSFKATKSYDANILECIPGRMIAQLSSTMAASRILECGPIKNVSKLSNPSHNTIIMNNKACNFVPEYNDFGLHCDIPELKDQYRKELLLQFGFDPVEIDNISELQLLQTALKECPKAENSSQYVNPISTSETDQSTWCTQEDFDTVVRREGGPYINLGYSPQDIIISEVPRIKFIAEKFTRVKTDNIEIRKVDEKIVCLEYDVYDKLNIFSKEPVDVMRAYFSITSGCEKCSDKCTLLAALPSSVREKLDLNEENLDNIVQKEVEMIDDKLSENRSYLEDLRRILQRRINIKTKKNNSKPDLKCMYNMARFEVPPLDCEYSNTNLLSKKELKVIQDTIIKNCESRADNLSRKKINDINSKRHNANTKSDNVLYDILKNMGKKDSAFKKPCNLAK